jgi:hypothetical protein
MLQAESGSTPSWRDTMPTPGNVHGIGEDGAGRGLASARVLNDC